MTIFKRRLRLAKALLLHAANLQLFATFVACAVLSHFAGSFPALLCLSIVAACLLHRAARGAPNPASSDPAQAREDITDAFVDDIRSEAETIHRQTAMRTMADAIEAKLHGQMGKVGEQAKQMREIANEMARIAERSGENIVCSGMAADSSAEASRALANSTAEIETAITCIAQQMDDATNAAREAVAAGAEARAAMTQLTARIGAIASVSNRISELARQTNLLALNATIEAARAGEAGRGFVVVAGEVKALARQTAGLTSEISETIGAIGKVNKDAVRTVDQMERKISSIEEIARIIAQAVNNQREVSAAIAAHVQSNVEASDELSSRVQNLTQTMLENLDQTAMVHVKSTDLVNSTEQLETELKQTITMAIRTAAPEVSRRSYPRYVVSPQQQTALQCKLEVDGQAREFEMVDLSDAGCRIITREPFSTAAKGSFIFSNGYAAQFNTVYFTVITHFQNGGQFVAGVKFTNGCINAKALLGGRVEAA